MAVRDFRRLLAIRLVGQCGDGVFQAALFGAAFFNTEKATSAGEAALAFTVLLLPYSLVGPFAGIALDRWSRQRILLAANALRSLLVVVLAISLARTGATSTSTLLLALLTVSTNRFLLSGLSASLPRVVESGRLVTANAFTTTLGTAAAAGGGVAALQLRGPWGDGDPGASQIALVAAATYAAAGLLALRLGRHRLGPGPGAMGPGVRHVLTGLLEGTRHIRSREAATRALLAITGQRFFTGLAFVMILMLYTPGGFVHRGIGGLSEAIAAAVVGGLAAAVVTPWVVRHLGAPRWIVLVLLMAAAVAAICFPTSSHGALLAAGLGLGFASQAAKICVDTLLQEAIEDHFRGRVFAIYDMLFNVSFVAAAGVAAVMVPRNGHSPIVIATVSLGYALTAALYAACVRAGRARGVPEVSGKQRLEQ